MSYAPQIFKEFGRFLTNLSFRSNFVRTYFAFRLISHSEEGTFGQKCFGEKYHLEIGRSEIGRSEIGHSEIGRSEIRQCTQISTFNPFCIDSIKSQNHILKHLICISIERVTAVLRSRIILMRLRIRLWEGKMMLLQF
jgi:hypothetical protein